MEMELELLELTRDQLELSPAGRLSYLLGTDWPACREALQAAATLSDLAVLTGPVACALLGAPQRPFQGRVDLLIHYTDVEMAFNRLIDYVGAWPDGRELTGDEIEKRERWTVGEGRFTLRTKARGVDEIVGLRERADRVTLHEIKGSPVVRVPSLDDLAMIVAGSPWSEDAVFRSGLRMLLYLAGRYCAALDEPPRFSVTWPPLSRALA